MSDSTRWKITYEVYCSDNDEWDLSHEWIYSHDKPSEEEALSEIGLWGKVKIVQITKLD